MPLSSSGPLTGSPSGRRALLGLALLPLLPVRRAAAHAVVVTSEPAAGATLAAPPPRVTVRFNSRIDHGRSRLVLIGPEGVQVALDPAPEGEPTVLEAAAPAATPPAGTAANIPTGTAANIPTGTAANTPAGAAAGTPSATAAKTPAATAAKTPAATAPGAAAGMPDGTTAGPVPWVPGAWRLRWQVLAVDGHITRGDIPFTLSAP